MEVIFKSFFGDDHTSKAKFSYISPIYYKLPQISNIYDIYQQ